MTDLAITASQVIPSATDAVIARGVAAVAITAGQVVFLDPNTNTYKLWDANDTAANTRALVIALNSPAAGQQIVVQSAGLLTLGAAATMTAGLVYVASGTPGGIAPSADIVAGWRIGIVGVATTAAIIRLMLGNSGATR